jgi:xylan 1,4-beta-xylosidase
MELAMSRFHLRFLFVCFSVVSITTPSSRANAQTNSESIVIDPTAPAQAFPHFWEHLFGSGRARLSMRESYRRDLHAVKEVTAMGYIRFHGILLDEMGVYDEDAQGHPLYNFSYVDQVYDGLLENGVRPFVELSFMPDKLAAKNTRQAFWYHPNVSPPKDMGKWDDLIDHFARHLVERYGLAEVAKWYFEVWNEPNLDFWAGEPRQATYWQLYDHTANDLKRVSSELRVGGPATAQAAWVDAFIRHCVENHIPLDFVSSHVYGNDAAKDVLGTAEDIPRDKMVCRAISKVHDQIKSSPRPSLPLIWSEFNASYKNEPEVTDSTYMGPWLADTIRQCDGLVNEMSYWTFSDVFEEQGVVKQPFYGGFGLLAAGGIPKPSYSAFELLHRLGDRRLTISSESALITRRADNSLVIATWYLTPPEQPTGSDKVVTLRFQHLAPGSRAFVSRVDQAHGDPRPAYAKMGSPRSPTLAQLRELRQAARLPPPEIHDLHDGELIVSIPPQGLVLVEISSWQPASGAIREVP